MMMYARNPTRKTMSLGRVDIRLGLHAFRRLRNIQVKQLSIWKLGRAESQIDNAARGDDI
jgi:hypothetical protein